MTDLSTRELRFSYQQKAVVSSVSLQCQPGEVVVLLGANGAGKTTLLHLMARRLKPDGGQVFFDDTSHTDFSRAELARQVALMLQHENRDSMLSVREVVALGRMPTTGWWMPFSAEDHQHIDDAIEATGLQHLQQRRIDELSGGEWRRMILARALAQQASVLLLDEPTAGMDLKYQFEMLQHVRRLTKQNSLTTVVTLHDLNLAAMFADKIALMSQGKLLAMAEPEETLTAELVEEAFGVKVTVMKHPVFSTPLVVPLFTRLP